MAAGAGPSKTRPAGLSSMSVSGKESQPELRLEKKPEPHRRAARRAMTEVK